MDEYAFKKEHFMKIKKGIRLIAVGFLFTLVNLNITSGSYKINVTPDFVGWILIFFGCGMLGEYVRRRPYYQIGAFLLAVLSAGLWIAELVNPDLDVKYIELAATLITTLYIFILLGLLQKIARDSNSSYTGSLGILKFAYLAVYVLFQAASYFINVLPLELLSVILTIAGAAALVTAVITCIVLFRLSFEIE